MPSEIIVLGYKYVCFVGVLEKGGQVVAPRYIYTKPVQNIHLICIEWQSSSSYLSYRRNGGLTMADNCNSRQSHSPTNSLFDGLTSRQKSKNTEESEL